MDQACRWVNIFLANAVFNDDIIVTSQQRFVSGVVVCQLVCRLAVDILNIIVSHALFICRLVQGRLIQWARWARAQGPQASGPQGAPKQPMR